jgi:O-antigen ligase
MYFLTVICVVEFVADVHKNSFDWMQCLFHLRMVFFLLLCLVFITIFVDPNIVMAWLPGAGIRLLGGTVAPVGVISPLMAIISAYSFLFSLESKARSALFFMAGLAGTLITQSRGCELAFLASLALLGILWSGTSKRNSYLFIASSFASVLIIGAVLAVGGGGRIWNIFNRGQNIEGVASVSGRADIWKFVINYCMAHPLGMGYIAGFRTVFKAYTTYSQQFAVAHIGNAHNSFMDVLADAGWPALAVYLILLVKIIALGWRYARKRVILLTASEQRTRHALRCTLALLVFCLVCGIDSSDFCIPLRSSFYLQNIVFAMILGISASMLIASRAQPLAPPA